MPGACGHREANRGCMRTRRARNGGCMRTWRRGTKGACGHRRWNRRVHADGTRRDGGCMRTGARRGRAIGGECGREGRRGELQGFDPARYSGKCRRSNLLLLTSCRSPCSHTGRVWRFALRLDCLGIRVGSLQPCCRSIEFVLQATRSSPRDDVHGLSTRSPARDHVFTAPGDAAIQNNRPACKFDHRPVASLPLSDGVANIAFGMSHA